MPQPQALAATETFALGAPGTGRNSARKESPGLNIYLIERESVPAHRLNRQLESSEKEENEPMKARVGICKDEEKLIRKREMVEITSKHKHLCCERPR